jgi:hypothetical protein
VLAGLWLVLHVFTVAALPVADGFADHGTAAVAHFEDADGGTCPASHAHGCDLCQFAQGLRAIGGAESDFLLPAADDGAALPQGRLTVLGDLAFLDGHSSRAPPALG